MSWRKKARSAEQERSLAMNSRILKESMDWIREIYPQGTKVVTPEDLHWYLRPRCPRGKSIIVRSRSYLCESPEPRRLTNPEESTTAVDLYVKNHTGWRNLNRLITYAFKYKTDFINIDQKECPPFGKIIPRTLLESSRQGLIVVGLCNAEDMKTFLKEGLESLSEHEMDAYLAEKYEGTQYVALEFSSILEEGENDEASRNQMGKLARKVISSLNRIHIDAVIPGDFDVDESFFTFLADQEDSGNEEAEDELINSLLSHTEVFNASFDPTFPLSDAFIGLNAEYPGIQWPYAGEDLLTLIENKLALYCGTEKKRPAEGSPPAGRGGDSAFSSFGRPERSRLYQYGGSDYR